MKKVLGISMLLLVLFLMGTVRAWPEGKLVIDSSQPSLRLQIVAEETPSPGAQPVEHENKNEYVAPEQDKGVQEDEEKSSEDENDVVRIFGSASVDEKEQVRDVVLIFSDGSIKGHVSGDCVVIGGRLHLYDGARIEQDLVTILSSLTRDRGAVVKGDTVNIGGYETGGVASTLKGVFGSFDFLLALLLLLLGWRWIQFLTDRFLMNPASSFLTGFLAFLAFIPAIILLAISIVGILCIPLLPIFYYVGFSVGFAIMGNMLGGRIADLLKKEMQQPLRSILGLVALLIILKAMALFPIMGGLTAELIKMLIRTFGLGVLLAAFWSAARRSKKD